MSGEANASNKILFKKLEPKLHSFGKININNIIPRNNSNPKLFEGIMKDKSSNKDYFVKKNKISPYKNHFNKSLSSILFNKPNNNALKKPQKFYIKSPLNFFKNNQSPPKNINKNIPLIPVNLNHNKNNKALNKNQQHSVEYNTINCIINNFNLSCKNGDSKEDKKTCSLGKINKIYDYEIFNKNNHKIKNNINNMKKNNSMNHYVNNMKNISHLSDNNNSNINNLTNLNDESKIEEIIMENQKKELKIKKRNEENKSKLLLIKELERKNQKLKLEYQEIKNKNMEYSKSLERLFKFLKVLKQSGLDISEMMDNISSGEDYDEFDETTEEVEKSDTDKKNTKNKNDKKPESSYRSEGSTLVSNINQLSSGLIKPNEEYTKTSKLNLNKNIPQLNIDQIQHS
jgi:hypothetical protein